MYRIPAPAFLPAALLTALMTAACTPVPGAGTGATPPLETEGPTGGLPEMCKARDWRHLVGSNVAAVTVPTSPMLRLYSDRDLIAQDYNPQRTNIVYSANGTIYRVWCG